MIMTVNELGEALSLTRLSEGLDRDIASCYISDLLSRVLGGCQSGDIWITVQSSINMVAVAVMADAACVILPEGLTASDDVIEKATEEGLTIFSSEEPAYTLAIKISKLI
jgi:predicted transcriptional regulator